MSYFVLQPLFAGLLVVAGVLMGALALRAFTGGRMRAGLRRTGWALVPFGLLAVGVAGLGARIVAAVTRWGFGLVFSPVSCLGVVLIATGVLLVLVTRQRSSEVDGRTPAPAQTGARNPYAPLPPSSAPPQAATPTSTGKGRSSRDAGASGLLAELEEMGLLDDDR